MRAVILQDILNGTDALDIPIGAKEQFKSLVRQMGVSHGVSGMAHAEQVDYARRLLSARTSRATIRDRLMSLFEVSRSQAYIVIRDALSNCAD